MPGICFYFQVHQPYRLRRYTFFDIGESPFYEDEDMNRSIMSKVARKSYIPMNALLLKLIKKHKGQFRVSFSISGTAIDQMRAYAPEALESFRALVNTGAVELLAETYNHSLACVYSPDEFRRQVNRHKDAIKDTFGVTPTVLRNTDLIYNNDVAAIADDMGYKAVLLEGADHVLGWRSPNFLYSAMNHPAVKLLLKNYSLSDDVAFKFSKSDWDEYPLTADKFSAWIHGLKGSSELINLFMDYKTFGERHWSNTGIFEFMEALPELILKDKDFSFVTPSDAVEKYSPAAELDVPDYVSWRDLERGLNTWIGNDTQRDALETAFRMEQNVLDTADEELYRTWSRILTSDHFKYMSTKWVVDDSLRKSFNPYNTPYDAYINYMNVLADFSLRVDNLLTKKPKTTKKKATEAEQPQEKKATAKKPAKKATKAGSTTQKSL